MSPLPLLSDVLLRTQTDERLARLAGAGDHWAFAALVQRHRSTLLRLARSVVGTHRSEDVVQQALLRAWVSLDAGTEVRNVQAWLYTIVRNAAYTELARGPDPAGPIPDEVADSISSDLVEDRLLIGDLMASIAALPEHQRMALVETELGGRSRRQIAADMGVTEGAVRQLVHRARTALRLAMTAITPFPVVAWMSRSSGGSQISVRLAGLGDGEVARRSAGLAEPAAAGAAGGTALAVKGGVALLAAGAIGGLGWQGLTGPRGHFVHHARPARLTLDRGGERTAASASPVASPENHVSFDVAAPRAIALPVGSGTGALTSRAGEPTQTVGAGDVGSARRGGSDSGLSVRSDDSGHHGSSGGGGSGGDLAEHAGGRSPGPGGEHSGSSESTSGSTGSATGTDGKSSAPPPATASSPTNSSGSDFAEMSSSASPTSPTSGDH